MREILLMRFRAHVYKHTGSYQFGSFGTYGPRLLEWKFIYWHTPRVQ